MFVSYYILQMKFDNNDQNQSNAPGYLAYKNLILGNSSGPEISPISSKVGAFQHNVRGPTPSKTSVCVTEF